MKNRIIYHLLFNGVFILYFINEFLSINPFLYSLVINLSLFVLPGMAWVGILKSKCFKEDIVAYTLGVFALSILISLLDIIVHIIISIPISALSHFIYLVVISNCGISIKKAIIPQFNKKYLLIFLLIVHITANAFSMIVMKIPFPDSDWDLQGTAYGLVHRLSPKMATDRKTLHDLSHPPLSHFSAANTILLYDQLDNVKYYYDKANEAEKIQNKVPNVGETIEFITQNNNLKKLQITNVVEKRVVLNGFVPNDVMYYRKQYIPPFNVIDYSLIREMKVWRLVQDSYSKFFHKPYLESTRNSYYIFTLFVIIALFTLLYKLSDSYFISILGSLLYFTIPEILISLSSTNHVALTSFIIISSLYFYIQSVESSQTKSEFKTVLFLCGLLCPIINQKTLILVLSILVYHLLNSRFKNTSKGFIKIVLRDKFLIGFSVGLLAFIFYGLMIDPHALLSDHFGHHFFNRIVHRNVLGDDGFPTVFKLWKMYASNVGYIIFGLGICSVFYYALKIKKGISDTSILPIFYLVGAFSFSIVDQRGTNNLSYITPALIILMCLLLNELNQKGKVFAISLLLLGMAINGYIIVELFLGARSPMSLIPWI